MGNKHSSSDPNKWRNDWLSVSSGYVGALGVPNPTAWQQDDTCVSYARKMNANKDDFVNLRAVFVKQCMMADSAPSDLAPLLNTKAMILSGATLGAFILGVTDNWFATLGAAAFFGGGSGWFLRREAQQNEKLEKHSAVVKFLSGTMQKLIDLIEWATNELLKLVDLDLATLQWIAALLLSVVTGFSVFAFGRYLKYAWIGIGPRRATPLLQ